MKKKKLQKNSTSSPDVTLTSMRLFNSSHLIASINVKSGVQITLCGAIVTSAVVLFGGAARFKRSSTHC